MKRILLAIMTAALCLNLCACGDIIINTTAPIPTPDLSQGSDVSGSELPALDSAGGEETADGGTPVATVGISVVPADVDSMELSPTPQPTPLPTPAATPVPIVPPAPTPTPIPYVYVTKSPTSEVTLEGGMAQFVAYAENNTSITWLLMDPNSGAIYDCSTLGYVFPGLYVSGYSTGCLTLGNLPTWMSGWYVQARFTGYGGPVHTDTASFWVLPVSAVQPSAPGAGAYILPNGFPYVGP